MDESISIQTWSIIGAGIFVALRYLVDTMFKVIDHFSKVPANGGPSNQTILNLARSVAHAEKTQADIMTVLISMREELDTIARETHDLHMWHNVDDPREPGSKIWWLTASMKESLELIRREIEKTSLAMTVTPLKSIFEEILLNRKLVSENQDRFNQALQDMRDRIRNLEGNHKPRG